ncbi:ABC transporter ATP-binding protein [Natrinema sp. H-ect4]|uniref:ABC transporter ATP-binding protein n=1 Tax=Natrinema sp. H-ect4 TaxID=3242699 RepID=UPI0035A98215
MNFDWAINTSSLSKRYGDTTAVDELSLRIEPGTIYGFLGPNGAGKTTTMRMLTALTKPTSGTASIAGEPISDREAVTPLIGYLSHGPPVYEELTGREQLEFFARLREFPEDVAKRRIDRFIARFGLEGDAGQRIRTYSKGMRQKIGIINAILHEPPVVFLDEPTAGLDPHAARTVRETIATLADGDTTVFLSTHILSVVDELADTVGVLKDGRLVAEGNPDELKDGARTGAGNETLEDVFLEITGDRSAQYTNCS